MIDNRPPSTPIIDIFLSIGNSRYHWAWFLNTKLQASWDTAYLAPDRLFTCLPIELQQLINTERIEIDRLPIYLSSVVASQTEIWQQLPQVKLITLADIPLNNLYPTLGIDRALAALGAGEIYGYPVLVIDGGTALTITGIAGDLCLVGGAILPGLRLQLQSLAVGTAALPEITLPTQLPTRWSNNTPEAIASGILHTLVAGISDFIRDWHQLFPESQVILTGGDGEILTAYLHEKSIEIARFDRDLLFYGIAATID